MQEWLHSESGILKQLIHFSEDFVKCDIDIEGFDDEDLDAWTAEAQRWARLLFLMVEGDHDLDPVCQVCISVFIWLLAAANTLAFLNIFFETKTFASVWTCVCLYFKTHEVMLL